MITKRVYKNSLNKTHEIIREQEINELTILTVQCMESGKLWTAGVLTN